MEFELVRWSNSFIDDLIESMSDRSLLDSTRENYPYPFRMPHAVYYIEQRILNDEEKQCCRAITVDGRAVGGIDILIGSDTAQHTAELLIWIRKEYRSHGIGRRAVEQMCKYAFSHYRLDRIEGKIYPSNPAAEKMLHKVGFEYEGTLRKAFTLGDRVYDCRIMSVIK